MSILNKWKSPRLTGHYAVMKSCPSDLNVGGKCWFKYCNKPGC